MCICKHLESVASGRLVRVSHADKQRRMFFELAMCFVLPAVIMALRACLQVFDHPLDRPNLEAFADYIVQGHRFDILEGFGCQPATYYSIPGVFIVWLDRKSVV